MPGTNITMLQIVANGLGELKDEMVFVGGAVAELYANDNFTEGIETALPYGSAEERVEMIEELISAIAVIE